MKPDTVAQPDRLLRRESPIYSSHFDLVRGIAAMIVMIGHLKFRVVGLDMNAKRAAGLATGPVNPIHWMNPPHQAVIVFFVLSGVLVGGSVLRERAANQFSWITYASKRLSRLLTVLVPALVLGLLMDWSTKLLAYHHAIPANVHRLDWQTFLGNLCFLQTLDRTSVQSFGSNTALWSLAFEFWFYVLFPVLVGFFVARANFRKFAYGVVSLLLSVFLWRRVLEGFLIWLIGALITLLPTSISEKWQRPFVLLMTLQFLACSAILYKHAFSNELLDDLILASSFAALLFAMLHRRSRRPRTMYASFAEHIARPSYTLYAFHMPILTLIATWVAAHAPTVMHHRLICIAAIGLPVYGLCYGLYFAFEAKTEWVRRNFASCMARVLPMRIQFPQPTVIAGGQE